MPWLRMRQAYAAACNPVPAGETEQHMRLGPFQTSRYTASVYPLAISLKFHYDHCIHKNMCALDSQLNRPLKNASLDQNGR